MAGNNENNRATIIGLVALLLWSMTVGLVRSISEQIGPVAAGAAVYLVGGLFAIICLLSKKQYHPPTVKDAKTYYYTCGALFLVYSVALFLALSLASNRTQMLEVGLLNYLWPALALLFSLLIFKKKARIWLYPAMLLTLWGIFLVLTSTEKTFDAESFRNMWQNPPAYACGFVAAISWALYSNLTEKYDPNSKLQGAPWFILLTGVSLTGAGLFFPSRFDVSLKVIIEVFILGLTTAVAYSFWEIAMKKGNKNLILSSAYVLPLLSTVFSCLYLKIIPQSQLWFGSFCIVFGSFVGYRAMSPKKN